MRALTERKTVKRTISCVQTLFENEHKETVLF